MRLAPSSAARRSTSSGTGVSSTTICHCTNAVAPKRPELSLSFGVAMLVASCKATLVAAVFMHLIWDEKINVIVLAVSVLAMLLFFSITLMDELSRGLILPEEGTLYKQHEEATLKEIANPPAAEHGGGHESGKAEHKAAAGSGDGSAAAPAAGSGSGTK